MMSTIRQWLVLCMWSLTDSLNRLASRIEGYTARREAERLAHAGEPRKPLSRSARVATYAAVYALLYGTQGVETCILWRWFAVPLGAPALSLWNAVGFALIVGSVTYAPRVESKVGVEVMGRLQRAGIRLAVGFVCWIAMGGWR